MPIVKIDPYHRHIEAEPIPGVRRQEYRTPHLEQPSLQPTKPAEAFRSQIGDAMFNLGMSFWQRIAERHARLEAQNADQQLGQWELATLDDPEKGLFATVRGQDAHKLLQQVPQDFKAVYQGLEDKLSSQAAKDMFQEMASQREMQVTRNVMAHVQTEEEKFAQAQAEGTIAIAQSQAAANATDPVRRQLEIEKIKSAIANDTTMTGLPDAYRQQKTFNAVSKAHTMVVDSLLAKGQDLAASEYLKQHQEEFFGDDRARYEAKLATANSETLGSAAADVIWKKQGPQSDDSPVDIDQMLDTARTQITDPKVYEATKQSLTERMTAFDAGRAQRSAANESAVWKAVINPKNPAGLDDVGTMPQYLALSGDRQKAVRDAIANNLQSIKERARGDEEYVWRKQEQARTVQEQAEQDKTKAAYGRYFSLSDPQNLSRMSRDQVQNLLPEMGFTLTNDLLREKDELSRQETSKKFEDPAIDDDLFKALANDAGLKAYAKESESNDVDRARLGQLRNAAKDALARDQRSRKRTLTRQEQQDVIQSVIDQKVMLTAPWSQKGKTVPAATVLPGESGGPARVPLAKIPAVNQNEAVQYMKSVGVIPQGLSPGAALQQFGDRIERAYAAHLSGRYEDEEQILQGK